MQCFGFPLPPERSCISRGLPTFALNINLEALNDLFDLLFSNPVSDLL